MALTRLGLNQSINLATNTTGTLAVANGGTGLTSGTSGQFLKFTGSTTVASSAVDAGKVLQTVQHTFTTEQNYNNSSYEASFITGAITPSAASSKIFIMVETVSANNDTANSYSKGRIYRGTTAIGNEIHYDRLDSSGNSIYRYMPISLNYLDSPNTTSATTYTFYRLKQGGGLGYIGINTTLSTLTLMEIGA